MHELTSDVSSGAKCKLHLSATIGSISLSDGFLRISGRVDQLAESSSNYELALLIGGVEVAQALPIRSSDFETGTDVENFNINYPLSEISVLLNLQVQVLVRCGSHSTLATSVSSADDDLRKLQVETARQCLHAIQNPAYRLRDRAVLMRLALEAKEKFHDNAEIALAALCVLAYGFFEDPRSRSSFLPKIFQLEAEIPQQLAKLSSELAVRWGASAYIGMAYLYLMLHQLTEVRRCLQAVIQFRNEIEKWPSIDLNVARAFFSLGCLEQIAGNTNSAIETWQGCVAFAKEATAVKVFNYYYKIEETRETWSVALNAEACVSLARVRLGKGTSIDNTLRHMRIVPSKVCGYLVNLDAQFELAFHSS